MLAKQIVFERIVPENKDKPVFDEQTLAKVLEAAYLLPVSYTHLTLPTILRV